MWIVFVAGKTVYGQFATTKLATTESQIATGGDLTFSSCVACRVKLVDITNIVISLRKVKPEWFSLSDIRHHHQDIFPDIEPHEIFIKWKDLMVNCDINNTFYQHVSTSGSLRNYQMLKSHLANGS